MVEKQVTRPAITLVLTLLLAGCRSGGEPVNRSRHERVLFIGNSYTAFNGGLYNLLPEMARQRGHQLDCVGSVRGLKTLEWHFNESKACELIRQGNWDYVVLQEFSTRPLTDPARMHEYVRKFDSQIRAHGGKTVLYLTWARQHQPENQQKITAAYESIAREIGATVAPVGLAWETSLRERPDLPLHRADRSHPNAAGTYLAACVFYATLLHESPVGLSPPTIKEEGMEPRTLSMEETRWLQHVAAITTGVDGLSSGLPARSSLGKLVFANELGAPQPVGAGGGSDPGLRFNP